MADSRKALKGGCVRVNRCKLQRGGLELKWRHRPLFPPPKLFADVVFN